jgi:hypothetical protein
MDPRIKEDDVGSSLCIFSYFGTIMQYAIHYKHSFDLLDPSTDFMHKPIDITKPVVISVGGVIVSHGKVKVDFISEFNALIAST